MSVPPLELLPAVDVVGRALVTFWLLCGRYECDCTARWKALSPRFWTISFNDVTVEVVFSVVQLVKQTQQLERPSEALVRHLAT